MHVGRGRGGPDACVQTPPPSQMSGRSGHAQACDPTAVTGHVPPLLAHEPDPPSFCRCFRRLDLFGDPLLGPDQQLRFPRQPLQRPGKAARPRTCRASSSPARVVTSSCPALPGGRADHPLSDRHHGERQVALPRRHGLGDAAGAAGRVRRRLQRRRPGLQQVSQRV